MPSKRNVHEESWSSFHNRYSSSIGHPRSASRSATFFDDDDGDGKNWFVSLVDMIVEPSKAEKERARRIITSDDDSLGSMDSAGKKSKRGLLKRKPGKRRQGNVKLSSFVR